MGSAQVYLRLPIDLLSALDDAAKKQQRKLSDEIVERLQWSFTGFTIRPALPDPPAPPAVTTEVENSDHAVLDKIAAGRRCIDVEEAARVLGVSRGAAYSWANKKIIPSIRIGKRLLVPVAALKKLLDSAQAVEA